MSTLKKLIGAIAIALLAACTDGSNTVTLDKAQQMQNVAANKARDEAEAKIEGKYVQAQAEMNKLAADTVRNGKFMATANCNVKPEGFTATSAAKTFPGKAFDFYRDACVKYVGIAVAEAKRNRDQAVAAEKQRQAKVAAAKAKQEQKVAKLKACAQKPTQKQRDDCRAEIKRHA